MCRATSRRPSASSSHRTKVDLRLFTGYERFADHAAMDQHNQSAVVVGQFYAIATPLLGGPVKLVTAEELSAKT